MELRVEALGALAAFAITAAFLWSPTPRLMALFVFFAQPLFLLCSLLYLMRVARDLRGRKVL